MTSERKAHKALSRWHECDLSICVSNATCFVRQSCAAWIGGRYYIRVFHILDIRGSGIMTSICKDMCSTIEVLQMMFRGL